MGESEAVKHEECVQVLGLLADIQRKSAPIELSIGWISASNTVMPGIVIKSAPPVVMQKLVEAGYCLDVSYQGVKVYRI